MGTNLDWLASPALIDWILVAMMIEALLLHRLGRLRALDLPWADVLSLLLPGAFLLLAVRGALAGNSWFVLSALLGALIAHLHDLKRRLRASGRAGTTARPAAADQSST